MSENGNGTLFGKRKFYLAVIFVLGWFGLSTWMLLSGNIDSEGYLKGLSTTSYVVISYIGLNVVKSGVDAYMKRKQE